MLPWATLTEETTHSLSLSLSLSLCIYLSLSLSVSDSLSLELSFSLCLCIGVWSLPLSVCLSVCLTLSLFPFLLCLCRWVCLYPSLSLSLSLWVSALPVSTQIIWDTCLLLITIDRHFPQSQNSKAYVIRFEAQHFLFRFEITVERRRIITR